MNKKEILAFVQANKFPVNEQNTFSRCVDGRYDQKDLGAVALPGGDVGLWLVGFSALNSLGFSENYQHVLDAVLETVGGVNHFHLHTDTHTEHDHKGIAMGCGHVKHAMTDFTTYGLTEPQSQFIKSKLPELLEAGAKQTVLEGEHEESAVLIVESDQFSVVPKRIYNEKTQEAFVFQKTLATKLLQKFSSNLTKRIQGLNLNTLTTALETTLTQQLHETVSRLAQGKPVYTVKINETGGVELI